MKRYRTSEAVCPGHPDKICDQIADAIVEAYMKQDAEARVAVEVAISYQTVFIMGEVTSQVSLDIEALARQVIREIGYDQATYGFCYDQIQVLIDLHSQSPDIARGVSKYQELGAGDQGIMYGYATDETIDYLPLPFVLATKLAKRLTELGRTKQIPYLRPDGKVQVTMCYEEDTPQYVEAVVLSTQHDPDISFAQLRYDLELVMKEVIPEVYMTLETKMLINPTGRFVIGGPVADSGVTGRKLMVDTYGGFALHGGGAFSGKDPTKGDRTAAYYARYVAKNIVASKLARRVTIGVSYAIGVAKPLAITIDTHHTGRVDDAIILKVIDQVFCFEPKHMILELRMTTLPYQTLATFGHFGRVELDLPYERLDKVEQIETLLADQNLI